MRKRVNHSLISIALALLLGVAWHQTLDEAAQQTTLEQFQQALAVAAVARGFNAVISVAQGTELAVAPAGIGVTLTVGEVLDPLNDLIERFSALALLASVCLGIQLTLGQMLATPWLSAALTLCALIYLSTLWYPSLWSSGERDRTHGVRRYSLQVLLTLTFLRFVLVLTLLTTQLLDRAFLASEQAEAVAQLSAASTQIEQLQRPDASKSAPAQASGLLERSAAEWDRWLDGARQSLNVEQQLHDLQQRVEQSVENIIHLIVIFLLQTLILPVVSLWVGWRCLRASWLRIATTN